LPIRGLASSAVALEKRLEILPAMRVVAVYIHKTDAVPVRLPLMLSRVPAGFPSPADDYIDRPLDLTAHLVRHPEATFYVRAQGDSMVEAGILDGAILVVDRSVQATDRRVVVATVEGALTVKRYRRCGERVWLEAAARDPGQYPPIEVTDPDAVIWGVVVAAVNQIG
jgi:DNA polymerase V